MKHPILKFLGVIIFKNRLLWLNPKEITAFNAPENGYATSLLEDLPNCFWGQLIAFASNIARLSSCLYGGVRLGYGK